MQQGVHHAPGGVGVNVWRRSAVGVLIPLPQKPGAAPWPRPANWATLPADIRDAWDAKWRQVTAQTERE